MARFFIAGTNFPNGRAIIRGRDADHIRVLRLRAGDDIVICDGAGRDYKCRLVQTLEHEAEAEVIEVVPCKAEPTVRSTVFAGLPKGERSDFLVQKCTEMGVHAVVPVEMARSVARADRAQKKTERLARIAREAVKQCGRAHVPEVLPALDLPRRFGACGSTSCCSCPMRRAASPLPGALRRARSAC